MKYVYNIIGVLIGAMIYYPVVNIFTIPIKYQIFIYMAILAISVFISSMIFSKRNKGKSDIYSD